MRAAALLVIVVAATSAAHAGVVENAADDVRIDWTRGQLSVTVPVHASLRAPSPGMARQQALRVAEQEARRRLVGVAIALSWRGTTVGEAARKAGVADRLGDGVIEVDTRHGTNGSVVVTRALPLEWAAGLIEPSRAAGRPEVEVSAIVVDAPHVKSPVLGIQLTAGGVSYRGPVFFYRSGKIPPKLLGARPIAATAKAMAARGILSVGVSAETLTAAAQNGAIVFVRLGKQTGK